MRLYLILAIILLISVYPSFSKEVAYAFGPDGEKPIGQANITDYKGTDVVSFTVSADTRGPSTSYKAQRTVDDIKEEINKKVDKGNELVRDEGLRLVGKRSGAQRIDQICSIYDYMVGNWTFVSDWSGLDVFQYSNYTLRKGNEVGTSGKGDCDDFSVLLASLIESIGGTPRIIFAYSPAGGHAYTEVYIGKSNSRDLDRMLRWLRTSYGANEVNVHADPENGDVWLNMDWWKDSGGAKHPGGPFYQATAQIPVYALETKAALTIVENMLPLVLFNYTPIQPEVGEMVSFNASKSSDPDGKIVDYEWDFGDGDTSHGNSKSISTHVYSSSGPFQVNLTITDSQDDKSSKVLNVNVVESHPEAVITYSPAEPKVGEVITFDASGSKGISGQIVEYEWDFGDGYSGKRVAINHPYYVGGTYNVALTVANDKGARNTSIINVTVGQKEKPVGNISASPMEYETATQKVVSVNAKAGELLYSDTFATRKESSWSIFSDANVERFYKDGKYHVRVINGGLSYWSFAGKDFKDFVLEVNATQEGGPNDNDYGVVTRYADPGNYSLFMVTGEGTYGFAKRENNQWAIPVTWTKSEAVKQGNSTNTIKLVSLRENLTFYANGVKLGDFTDSSPRSGDIGFWVETFQEGNVGIAFDDLKVWATPREASELLYSDSFTTRAESGWSTFSDANVTWLYKDGKYRVKVKNGGLSYWSFAGKDFKDFVLEVNATQEGGPDDNDYGIVIRYVEQGNYLLFLISGDGFYGFAKSENNQWAIPVKWTRSDAVKQGNSTNTIKLYSLGENLTLYANGVKLGDFTDSSPRSGDIGFWVETFQEGNVGIAFDNLKVWAAGR